jgi:hypothetical protein
MTAVVSATPGTGVSGRILAKGTSPDGIVISSRGTTDVTVHEITIASGGSTGWHYHDGMKTGVANLLATISFVATLVTACVPAAAENIKA